MSEKCLMVSANFYELVITVALDYHDIFLTQQLSTLKELR